MILSKQIKRLLQHRRYIQFVEYMIGGGVYFWSGMAVFAILYSGLQIDWLIAKIIADIIGFTLSYFVQRYWAFEDKRLKSKDPQVRRRYAGISVVSLMIDYGIVAGMKYIGITPYIGMVTSSLFFTLWNYLWYRFYVFDPKQKA